MRATNAKEARLDVRQRHAPPGLRAVAHPVGHATGSASVFKPLMRYGILVLLILVFLWFNLSLPVTVVVKDKASDTHMSSALESPATGVTSKARLGSATQGVGTPLVVATQVLKPVQKAEPEPMVPAEAVVASEGTSPEHRDSAAEAAVVSEQAPVEACAVWGCTCKGASQKYQITHGVTFGTAPEAASEWWVANKCTYTSSGAQSAVVAMALRPEREGKHSISLQELRDMMVMTPDSPTIEACVGDGDTPPGERDIWVHVHSPWHLFYQGNESQRQNLDVQWVNDEANHDFNQEDPKKRKVFPLNPHIKYLERDQALLAAPLPDAMKSVNTNADGGASVFRRHRVQMDARPLFSRQYWWYGNSMFCDNYRFSGRLLWERQRMDCVGIPLDMVAQCPAPLALTVAQANRHADLIDEVTHFLRSALLCSSSLFSIHIYFHPHAYTRTCTGARVVPGQQFRDRGGGGGHTHTRTHTHTHTHTCSHTHTQTHTHTHTHTHIRW
jgi:hypothetical protein